MRGLFKDPVSFRKEREEGSSSYSAFGQLLGCDGRDEGSDAEDAVGLHCFWALGFLLLEKVKNLERA